MKLKYCIFSFLLCLFYNGNAQDLIKGSIYSIKNNKPIPYASISVLPDNNHGTTTNINGEFELRCERGSRLYISSLGYFDTTVVVQNADENMNIELKEKVLNLNEVKVISKKVKKKQVGSKDISILRKNGGERILNFRTAGLTYGVYVDFGKAKNKRVLSSISCYIGSKGKLGSRYVVRLMACNKKMTDHKMENRSDFYDLTNKTIIFTANKRAWNDINCRDLNLQLPNQPFVIFFTPIDDGDKYKWEDDHCGESYGASFVFYNIIKIPKMYGLLAWEDKIAFIKNGRFPKIPGIVVNYVE